MYAIGGHDLLLPRLLNLGSVCSPCWLVARIARRVWGSQLAAVAAALAVAIFIPAIHFEAQIEKTALSVLLLAAALDAFLVGTCRRSRSPPVSPPASAVLARGNALAFVPLAALALALGWDREPGDPLVRHRCQRVRRSSSPPPCR